MQKNNFPLPPLKLQKRLLNNMFCFQQYKKPLRLQRLIVKLFAYSPPTVNFAASKTLSMRSRTASLPVLFVEDTAIKLPSPTFR